MADYGFVTAPGLAETTNVSVALNFSGGWKFPWQDARARR